MRRQHSVVRQHVARVEEKMSAIAKKLILEASVGSLGTMGSDGNPFVSLVTTAALGPTSLVMLLSGLAKHTKNLTKHSECSLMLVQPGGELGDPLAGARLTVNGSVRRLADNQAARDAFLAKHPSAEMYVDFGDFGFYELKIDHAYLVAGFGRIETIPASELET